MYDLVPIYGECAVNLNISDTLLNVNIKSDIGRVYVHLLLYKQHAHLSQCSQIISMPSADEQAEISKGIAHSVPNFWKNVQITIETPQK